MKKLIFALVLLLALPVWGCADIDFSKDVETHSTGCFSFSVPSDWIAGDNLDAASYYSPDFGPDSGFYLALSETHYPDTTGYTTEMMYSLVLDGMLSVFDYPTYSSEYINIGLNKAMVCDFSASLKHSDNNFATMLCFNDGYMFTASIASPSHSRDELKETLLFFSDTISFDADPPRSTYGIVKKGVNVRSGPTSESKKLGSASAGIRLIVTIPYYTEKWHQISFEGSIGYVSANYIELE